MINTTLMILYEILNIKSTDISTRKRGGDFIDKIVYTYIMLIVIKLWNYCGNTIMILS